MANRDMTGVLSSAAGVLLLVAVEQALQAVHGERRGPTVFDDGLLLIFLSRNDCGQLVCDLKRNAEDTMAVAVDQIARADLQSADDHRYSYFHNMDVGMRNGNMAGEDRKAQPAQGGQVAHCAIRDHTSATECPVNIDRKSVV